MAKALIQLTYRKIIDASSQTDFEKNVMHYSYEEYKMKSQAYNTDGTIASFSVLKVKDGRANSLHYKSGFAIGGFVDRLQNKIPSFEDVLGQPVLFETHKFEIIESDITDRLLHKVAIHFITGWLTLHQVIGDTLLLSKEKENDRQLIAGMASETFMLKMEPGLAIINYQGLPVLKEC